ncbi:hypothetical protein JIG36_38725 [Actinoplanes sp. LDG1-06]|uniref:Uncharacterized protein n=1 Tax=Paractinoplanes ovalisporus TaxID=2810368 RepID=A0ABS2ANT0_9ACTN|nr:hypothetical protein [Actinoplanes ovalisporus]MBM2621455.1 hypothetical protein [Actinoplanes ovalisporus]
MPEEPSIGRAPVGRPPRGRARVGRAVGKAATPENARTEMFEVGEAGPPPVFVDPTGGRRKWLRRTAYAVGVLLILALIAIWVSQLVGSADPPPHAPAPSAGVRSR